MGLTIAAVAWAALLLLGPSRMAAGEAPAAAVFVRAAGALVCHQRPERSFHLAGSPLPVCARCLGLYLSGALGALAGWFGRPREPRRARVLLAACALPMVISVGVEWAGLAASSNQLRAVSALPLGGLAGWLFVRMLRAGDRDQQMRYHFLV